MEIQAGPTTEVAPEPTMLRALAAHSTELLMLVRNDGVTHGSVVLGAAPLGYPDEIRQQSRHVAEVVHPDDLPRVLDLIEQVRACPGMSTTIDVRAKHFDGSWRSLQVAVIDRSDDPTLDGVVLRIRDATPIGSTGQETRGRFESLAEVVPCGILTADRRGHLVYANQAAQQILGLPDDALFGRSWEAVIHPADRGEVLEAGSRTLTTGKRDSTMFRVQHGNEEHWVSAAFVGVGDGRPTGWVATIEDVTERRRHESRLAHQATHDPLTGLPNRMLLNDRLEQAVARLRRSQPPLSVLFVDLDEFKAVNDRLGHTVGDRALVHVAELLRRLVRTEDTVARFGGDEFVTVAEGASPTDAVGLGVRIVDTLERPVLVDGARLRIRASVGIACTCTPVENAASLLLAADAAMYRAKNQGGRRVVLNDLDDVDDLSAVEDAAG